MPLAVRLESKDGEVLCEAPLHVTGRDWKRLTAALTPGRSEDAARLVLLARANGGIALDEISLFPRRTFRDRPGGLRADLAQTIADLRPKFVRFPGGCLVHGNGTNNFYRWKDTIGPVEQRRGQANLWGYHQSVGLGYFEYFQFELTGAKKISRQALKTVLAGEAAAVNGFDAPSRVAPVTSGIQVDRQFGYEAPAHSLTVLRIETR